jgi:hypothetical protein
MNNEELAKKILASGDLDKPDYILKDLFSIRDALEILKDYGLGDEQLLEETNKYIQQKVGIL